MDNYQLENILKRYPVTVCAADEIRKQNGRFVISNTDTSNGPGKHWVVFYFPRHGPYEYFDSVGNSPESYGVGFDKILNKKYLRNYGQLQQLSSNVCGLYCAYYVIKRYQGKTLKNIVKEFDPYQKKHNDRSVVSKMKKLIRKKK
jgi:hypothetical protein